MHSQLLLPGEIVKKDNQLIRTKLDIPGVEGSRILAALISLIKTNEPFNPDKTYSIAVKDIIKNSDGHSYQKIRTICKDLKNSSASIELFVENGEEEYFDFPFFSVIHYKKGIISAKFNFLMENFLFGLSTCFTEYNLLEYLKLSSMYSQRLFEILKSYSKIPEKEQKISIEDLHRYLSTPKSQVNNFALFKKETLSKAHQEIITKTNLYFDYEPIKGGKGGRTSPVIAIRFIFGKKKIEIVQERNKIQQKEKEIKTSQQNNKNFPIAYRCAKSCNGNCASLNEKPNKEACELCMNINLCEQVIKEQKQKRAKIAKKNILDKQVNFLETLENKEIK